MAKSLSQIREHIQKFHALREEIIAEFKTLPLKAPELPGVLERVSPKKPA